MICSKTSKTDKQDQFDLLSLHSIVLTYVLISFYSILSSQKSGQLSWLERPSGNHEVMSSNPTVSNRIFCNFFTLALSFPFLFPCLPKGIFPFPSNLKQPQLSSFGKCKKQSDTYNKKWGGRHASFPPRLSVNSHENQFFGYTSRFG